MDPVLLGVHGFKIESWRRRMSTAFLFPGQGSQKIGMLHDLPKQPVIAETIAEAGMV